MSGAYTLMWELLSHSPAQTKSYQHYLTVCHRQSGNLVRFGPTEGYGLVLRICPTRSARIRLPKGANFKYCSASRISGPPPPRQAAGDPSVVSTKFFNPRQRFFLRTGLPESFVYGRFRTRIQMGSVGALSWTSVFNFDVVD